MNDARNDELKEIKKLIETEFVDDPALQQVHIARKIIQMEAKSEGLSFFEFVKKQIKQMKSISK
ncbi:MAG: hypothetical protein ACTSRW_00170 [Candidatus Helarchaeota archaeon]